MDDLAVKTTIAGLISRVEQLQTENATLQAQNATCTHTVSKLVKRVEDLQARNAEISGPPRTSAYRKRPPVLTGRTIQIEAGCGPLYVTLNYDDQGQPFEIFIKLGKSGSCQQSYLEALGVALSVGLRYGADPEKFIEKFNGMRCPNPKLRTATSPAVLSCSDAISSALAKALELARQPSLLELPLATPREATILGVAEPIPQPQLPPEPTRASTNGHATAYSAQMLRNGVGLCPNCGGIIVMISGCKQCASMCGWIGPCG
jgi:ribonucleoside-diphosphate reductase alpha chain